MTTAFVLGNGRSREPIDLAQLKTQGPVYGCNALYRTFTPDVLIATDRPIATAIQDSGYAKKHRFYTRKPLPESGAHRLTANIKDSVPVPMQWPWLVLMDITAFTCWDLILEPPMGSSTISMLTRSSTKKARIRPHSAAIGSNRSYRSVGIFLPENSYG